MVKIKLPAIAALLLFLAACAAYAGHRADAFLDEATAGLQSRLPGVTLTLKERRWRIFYSVRTYRLDVAAGTFGHPRPLEADIRVWAMSGPVSVLERSIRPCLARVRASILLTQDASPEVIAFFGAAQDLLKSKLILLLGFDGAVTASLDIAPAQWAQPPKGPRARTLDWKGLAATARFAPGLEDVDFDARSPHIGLADQGGSLDFEDLSIRGKLVCGQGKPYHGRLAFAARRASLLTKDGGTGLALESPAVTLDLLPKGEVFDFVARVDSMAATGGGERFSLRAGATIGDLDTAAMARLPVILDELRTGGAQTQRVREWASAVLERSPWIAMEASLTLDSPDARADVAASLKTVGLHELPPQTLLALPHIQAEASLAAPPALMARLLCALPAIHTAGPQEPEPCGLDAATLDALADHGILSREGGRLRTTGQWDGSAFTVNGRRFEARAWRP